MATLFSNKQNEENQAKRAVATWIWENVISTDRNPRLIIDAGSSAQCVAEVIAERVEAMDEESIASALTATRAFEGETATDTLSAVISKDPD